MTHMVSRKYKLREITVSSKNDTCNPTLPLRGVLVETGNIPSRKAFEGWGSLPTNPYCSLRSPCPTARPVWGGTVYLLGLGGGALLQAGSDCYSHWHADTWKQKQS